MATIKLNFPQQYAFKIRYDKSFPEIFDVVRKKWVKLTPEENVRQHFLHYLYEDLQYPLSIISVEFALKYENVQKRADILVYNSQLRPYILVECKAPEVKLTQEVLYQIARYNMSFMADFLAITNGLQHFYFRKNEENIYEQVKCLPIYKKEK